MLTNYHQGDMPLHSRVNQTSQPMNEAPGGDRLRMTLLQVETENKELRQGTNRQESADQTRECSDPTHLGHPSTVTH